MASWNQAETGQMWLSFDLWFSTSIPFIFVFVMSALCGSLSLHCVFIGFMQQRDNIWSRNRLNVLLKLKECKVKVSSVSGSVFISRRGNMFKEKDFILLVVLFQGYIEGAIIAYKILIKERFQKGDCDFWISLQCTLLLQNGLVWKHGLSGLSFLISIPFMGLLINYTGVRGYLFSCKLHNIGIQDVLHLKLAWLTVLELLLLTSLALKLCPEILLLWLSYWKPLCNCGLMLLPDLSTRILYNCALQMEIMRQGCQNDLWL